VSDARPSTDWFRDVGFGMFVHWGHSSAAGRELSWPMVGGVSVLPFSDAVPVEEYQATAATFCPERGAARDWVRRAAAAGMGYVVFTARHHDGFSMFDSQHSDFSVAKGPYGGDIVGELVAAAREEGLRVGLYYSLSDWHHPDYPAFRDSDRPYQLVLYPRPAPEAWDRYLEYLFGQITELLTNYGPIDLLWFDGGWERSAHEWRTSDLHDLIRRLQPDVLINDRLPGFGDFDTPEQFVPAQPPARAWESCITMNSTWGYCPRDTGYKPVEELVQRLCEVRAGGGNLLLNVSPRGDGSLPHEQVERLDAIAQWMQRHRRSIVGATPGLEPWQFAGPSTKVDTSVLLHLFGRPFGPVRVRHVPIRAVKRATHLASGTELSFTMSCSVADQMFNSAPLGEVAVDVPEELVAPPVTVIELEMEESR
jgi:alpha-L-fucosidase